MSNLPLHILVVDDDQNFAHTLCAILSTEGYVCQEVHSVEAAQAVLANEHIDCVLSDVKMPNQSGPEFYYQIKDQFPNLPFILMTAYTSSEIIDDALQSGVLTALQKPINIQEILHFFAKLSQNLGAAVVCEEEETCKIIEKILEKERFTYTIYPSIQMLINSHITDYAIIFIDAHEFCEHYSEDIQKLISYLPERTIVVICDYKMTENRDKKIPEKVNLIILPREDKSFPDINKILQKKFPICKHIC